MVKVKFLKAGGSFNVGGVLFRPQAGEVRDMPEALAHNLVLSGTAEFYEPQIKVALSKLNKPELVKLAEEAGIADPDSLTKKEIAAALKALE